MAHARIRKNKMLRMANGPSVEETERPGHGLSDIARPLVENNKVVRLPDRGGYAQAWNLASKMDDRQTDEVLKIIQDRYFSAQPTTDAVAEKMSDWEKQYHGVWRDPSEVADEHVFLNKTRQRVLIVHAFLMSLVTQLPKLVEFRPKVQTLAAMKEEWQRAKIAEAMTNYYMDDVWKFRTDVLPAYVKTFLKFTTGIMHVCYDDDPHRPDLQFKVVDRAFVYFDPNGHDRRTSRWIIYKDFVSKSELDELFQLGVYKKPQGFSLDGNGLISGSTSNDTLRRFYGANFDAALPIQQDELVERWHFFQAPGRGMEDRYACTIGGEGNSFLAAYGPNPWPYKGLPFTWKSYDPHEWQSDGSGMVEMETGIQEILNTAVNARIDDWRRNLWAPTGMPEQFVNATTMQDWKERQSIIRFAQEAVDPLIEQGKPLQNYIVPFNMRAENSLQLFQDMSFFLSQGDEIAHTSQPFQGQAPTKVTTASEIQEILSRNQGVFRMPFMQIMRAVEEVAEISLQYFKDPAFFGPERILLATGPKHDAAIKSWGFVDGANRAASITPDQMDVDVTIIATSGADALLARSFKAMVGSQLLASIGQVEGLYPEIRDELNWREIILDQLRAGTSDVSMYELTDEEKQQRIKQREQQQQQAMQQQQQQQQQVLEQQVMLQAKLEQAKAGAKAQGEIAVDQAQAKTDFAIEHAKVQAAMQTEMAKLSMQAKAEIQKTLAQIAAQSQADVKLAMVDLRNDLKKMLIESVLTMREMTHEQELEVEAAKETPDNNVSIGVGGNNINSQ